MEYVHNSWDKILADQFNAPYFDALMQKVNREYDSSTVYPPKDKIFAALKTVDYDKIKVVIIGQDPYHGEGQANGMAFSVNKGVALPPSLVNIFKEIKDEYGAEPDGGTLTGWAKQGDTGMQPPQKTDGFYAVGLQRHRQKKVYFLSAASRFREFSPQSALGLQGIFRVRSLQKSQRLPAKKRL